MSCTYSCNCNIANKSFRLNLEQMILPKYIHLVNRVFINLINMLHTYICYYCCFKRDFIDILCKYDP